MTPHPTYVVFSRLRHRGRSGTDIKYVGPSQKEARKVAEGIVGAEMKTGQSDYNAHIQAWSEGELMTHCWGTRKHFREGELIEKV